MLMYSMSDSCSGKKIVQNKLLFWLLITSEKHTGPLIILHQLTFSSHYINSKTRKREYKIQSKLGRRIKPEKGEYTEIFVNPKNPTELYEPADNFSSEDYINSEWVTIKNLTIGGTLLMLTGWTLICFIL